MVNGQWSIGFSNNRELIHYSPFTTSAHYLLQIVVAGRNTCIGIGGHVMFYKKMFHPGNICIVEDPFEIDDTFTDRSRTLFFFVEIFNVPQVKTTRILFEKLNWIHTRLCCPTQIELHFYVRR